MRIKSIFFTCTSNGCLYFSKGLPLAMLDSEESVRMNEAVMRIAYSMDCNQGRKTFSPSTRSCERHERCRLKDERQKDRVVVFKKAKEIVT